MERGTKSKSGPGFSLRLEPLANPSLDHGKSDARFSCTCSKVRRRSRFSPSFVTVVDYASQRRHAKSMSFPLIGML